MLVFWQWPGLFMGFIYFLFSFYVFFWYFLVLYYCGVVDELNGMYLMVFGGAA
jgi:hypothetical protein